MQSSQPAPSQNESSEQSKGFWHTQLDTMMELDQLAFKPTKQQFKVSLLKIAFIGCNVLTSTK